MATRRNALGRGLGALIPAPSVGAGAPRADSSLEPEPRGPYTQIEVERIRPNPQQPRRTFGAEELGLLGAEAYLRSLDPPVLMINLDSVGRASVDSYRKLRQPVS